MKPEGKQYDAAVKERKIHFFFYKVKIYQKVFHAQKCSIPVMDTPTETGSL